MKSEAEAAKQPKIREGFQVYRRRAGFSQRYAAMRLGITPVSLCFYENGRAEPNIDVLIRMSELYKVSIDDLVKYKVPTTDSNHAYAEFVEDLEEFSNDLQNRKKVRFDLDSLLDEYLKSKKK